PYTTLFRPQLSPVPFLSGKLDARSRGAAHFGAAAGAHFYCVQHCAHRDIAQRQIITDRDVGLRTGFNGHILLETVGGDDIALLAVGVMQQGDTRRAIGVVLDLSDARRHTVLVIATEVDLPVGPLVPAALMTGGDAAL